MPATTRSQSFANNKHQQIATLVVAVGLLILLLATNSKTLLHDWTPVGIGVKLLLALSVGVLLYLPYKMFSIGTS